MGFSGNPGLIPGGAGGAIATGGATGFFPSGGSAGFAPATGGTFGAGGSIATGGAPAFGAGGLAGTGGDVASSGGAGPIACDTPPEETFSFFLISYEAIRRESGSQDGFGGDLGGIEGADDICRRVALSSSSCAGNQTWRAFLSTTTEAAIDRIGTGPWHDRLGRLLANNVQELLNDRPPFADPAIIDDFPNEFGVPNRNPDGLGNVDNHQILTGTGIDGRLYTQSSGAPPRPGPSSCGDAPWTAEKATCWDWTVADPVGCPRVGHSWPRAISGLNWMSVWNEGGCAPGVYLRDTGGLNGDPTVGSAGGYGGFYCFAITP
jgi:hypothetical protein